MATKMNKPAIAGIKYRSAADCCKEVVGWVVVAGCLNDMMVCADEL